MGINHNSNHPEQKEYYVQVKSDGNISVHTKVKKWFKEVKENVSLSEFFNVNKVAARMGVDGYCIFPQIKGMSPNSYLYTKARYNLLNGYSDFNKRTIWNITNFSTTQKRVVSSLENMENEPPLYLGEISGSLNVVDEEGNVIFNDDNFKFNYYDNHIYSERESELILQNAANGMFTTARDLYYYIDEVNKNCGQGGAKLICEECGEIFESLPEFFSHLIETGHKDSILAMHRFDPEIRKVIGLINRNKEEA